MNRAHCSPRTVSAKLETRLARVTLALVTALVALACGTSHVARAADKQVDKQVRPAPHMPAPKFVETNGIRMAVYEQGEGVPVVLCHGFPELAFSWRHQVKALAEAGFRAIAP